MYALLGGIREDKKVPKDRFTRLNSSDKTIFENYRQNLMTITNKIKIAIFDLANSMCNIQTTAFIRLNSVCQKPFLQIKPLTPILMTLVCVPRSYATCCLKMTQSKFFANN